MLEVILIPFLLDTVAPNGLPLPSQGDVAELLSCDEASQLIKNIEDKAANEVKKDLIDTIKQSTNPECYEGSEPNS
tara:strand:- start:103 stop:330 length:228 start_codon:yes stop_codon:yes gene_type:complete